MRIYLLLLLVLIISFGSCSIQKLPKEKFASFKASQEIEYKGDSLVVYVNNTNHSPLRYWITSEEAVTNEIISIYNPIIYQGLQDSTFYIPIPKEKQSPISLSVKFGDPTRKIDSTIISYPFPLNRSYKIVQGNNSNPSHNHSGSMYAIDFSLKINDTICSSTDGYVIGVVDGYSVGGANKKWKPYGNYIYIFDPVSGLYFQYAHLVHKGSLVKVGDKIERGQAIGLSGMTGYTTVEHLHFNCYKPDNSKAGMSSYSFTFSNGKKTTFFKRGMRVSR